MVQPFKVHVCLLLSRTAALYGIAFLSACMNRNGILTDEGQKSNVWSLLRACNQGNIPELPYKKAKLMHFIAFRGAV